MIYKYTTKTNYILSIFVFIDILSMFKKHNYMSILFSLKFINLKTFLATTNL